MMCLKRLRLLKEITTNCEKYEANKNQGAHNYPREVNFVSRNKII